MSEIDRLLVDNESFATGRPDRRLDARPSRGLAIVTCMDARIDLEAALGLARGDAHVLRNAGGIVSEDTIRSLAISQRLLGSRAVMLVHHTKCGMEGLDEEALAAQLREDAGASPPFAIGAFANAEASVRLSVERVRSSPFLPHRDEVRGFLYDVDTLRLREVEGGASGPTTASR
jgi:carbonic anhydrase